MVKTLNFSTLIEALSRSWSPRNCRFNGPETEIISNAYTMEDALIATFAVLDIVRLFRSKL